MSDPHKQAFNKAKSRALKQGTVWTLAWEDIGPPPARCPCCGVDMVRGDRNGGRRNTPTFDRLIPALGYTKQNVVYVCWLCNTTKSDHGLDHLYRVADFFWTECKRRGLPLPSTARYPNLGGCSTAAPDEEAPHEHNPSGRP